MSLQSESVAVGPKVKIYQDLDLENEESDYSKMSDPNDPQYEPGRSNVDSDIDLDLDNNHQPRPTTCRSI